MVVIQGRLLRRMRATETQTNTYDDHVTVGLLLMCVGGGGYT
jgi:hypothetical protein